MIYSFIVTKLPDRHPEGKYAGSIRVFSDGESIQELKREFASEDFETTVEEGRDSLMRLFKSAVNEQNQVKELAVLAPVEPASEAPKRQFITKKNKQDKK